MIWTQKSASKNPPDLLLPSECVEVVKGWLTDIRKEETDQWRATNSPKMRDMHYWKELAQLLEIKEKLSPVQS